jgi:hypothetical protein
VTDREPVDVARIVKDWLKTDLATRFPTLSVALELPATWALGSNPVLVVADDGDPMGMWPAATSPTIRMTSWTSGRNRTYIARRACQAADRPHPQSRGDPPRHRCPRGPRSQDARRPGVVHGASPRPHRSTAVTHIVFLARPGEVVWPARAFRTPLKEGNSHGRWSSQR